MVASSDHQIAGPQSALSPLPTFLLPTITKRLLWRADARTSCKSSRPLAPVGLTHLIVRVLGAAGVAEGGAADGDESSVSVGVGDAGVGDSGVGEGPAVADAADEALGGALCAGVGVGVAEAQPASTSASARLPMRVPLPADDMTPRTMRA